MKLSSSSQELFSYCAGAIWICLASDQHQTKILARGSLSYCILSVKQQNWTAIEFMSINYAELAVTFFLTILFLRAFGALVSSLAADSAFPCLMPRSPRPETMAFFDMNHLEDDLVPSSEGLL